MARSFVLLGPPGAGKGTQAKDLATFRGLQHVSTGDLLRRAIAARTPLGLRVQETMALGRLVDDATVAELVRERLDEPGAKPLLLDGFPRTVGQAEQLARMLQDRGLPPPIVIEVRVPDDEVVRRLAARRTCPSCGPRPPGESACGSCSGLLAPRPDDAEPVVRARLQVYANETLPLVEYYRALGLLRSVDGEGSPSEVLARIREVAAKE